MTLEEDYANAIGNKFTKMSKDREIEEAKDELNQAVFDIVIKKDLDIDDYYMAISPTSCRTDLSVLASFPQLARKYVDVDRASPITDELFNKAYARLEKEYKQGWFNKEHISCEYNSSKECFVCTDSKTGKTFDYDEI